MSEIDIQNAKQIRDPMDVLITMSLAADDITMSYSGYSDAKVADGVLNQPTWPMRKLADLQGDGFELDGSCVLYNPNTSASEANGKIGVRSNIGEGVSVTATGDKPISALRIDVTGAESVTYNGITEEITGNSITIPNILDYSVSFVFAPATESDRIEIRNIDPESDFRITNENLIRATVSLRSDLSIIEPTLPESEINIEVYHDLDISEAVAAIPEDTPIIYQAGYEDDMSPARKFYVAGQVTWADNVLSIHGVDAVHFLGSFDFTTLLSEFSSGSKPPVADGDDVMGLLRDLPRDSGVTFEKDELRFVFNIPSEKNGTNCVFERGTEYRDVLAFINNTWHLPNSDQYARYPMWLTFVDAGRPSITVIKPTPSGIIREDDCADIKKNVEEKIAKISIKNNLATFSADNIYPQLSVRQVGTVDLYKNEAGYVKLDDMVMTWIAGFDKSEIPGAVSDGVKVPMLPFDRRNTLEGRTPWGIEWRDNYPGTILGDSQTEQVLLNFYEQHTSRNTYLYTQIIPWSAHSSMLTSVWNKLVSAGIINSDDTNVSIPMWGCAIDYSAESREYESGEQGATREITAPLNGEIWGSTVNSYPAPANVNLFPDECIKSLFSRSNITGSFTWKGDPRMQPRDVVYFERLDGTAEEITLENITLTHENGGTSAEITYRKGIV